VRIHYIIGVTPGDHPCPDPAALEAEVAEAGRSWIDRFEAALRDADVDEVPIGPLSCAGPKPSGPATATATTPTRPSPTCRKSTG
jgi:hypothetical protein